MMCSFSLVVASVFVARFQARGEKKVLIIPYKELVKDIGDYRLRYFFIF